MDTSSAIIGAIFVALISMPFVIMAVKKKRKKQLAVNALIEIAEFNNSKIGVYEVCGKLGFALSFDKRLLFFTRSNNNSFEQQFFELSELSACNLIVKSSSDKDRNDGFKTIERITIQLIPKAKNEPVVNLKIFDNETDMQLYSELKFAEKWVDRIKSAINL